MSYSKKDDAADYVDKKLTMEAYLATYANIIHPVPDQTTWPTVEDLKILPPDVKARFGRPKTVRRREPGEQQGKRKTKQRCNNCTIFGHNKRACKNAPLDATGQVLSYLHLCLLISCKSMFNIHYLIAKMLSIHCSIVYIIFCTHRSP